jgi:hypothetical protein
MTSREILVRRNEFNVAEQRRRIAQIEATIVEFERRCADLDREIKLQQHHAGVHDPSHVAYPIYAKWVLTRRENLTRSVDQLKIQLDQAKDALDTALQELRVTEEGAEQ